MSERDDTIDQYKAQTLGILANTTKSKCEAANATAQAVQRLLYGASAFILATAAAKLILFSIAMGG